MTEIIRIANIDSYNQQIIDGELILTRKDDYITENELINNTPIAHSTIETCIIKKGDKYISTNAKSYRGLLRKIWSTMQSHEILSTTTFNFKLTDVNGENGYKWCPKLQMSFQSKNASDTLKEIINMCQVNKMSIHISIKLKTGRIIHFEFV